MRLLYSTMLQLKQGKQAGFTTAFSFQWFCRSTSQKKPLLTNINLEEYSKYICCLHDNLTPEKFEELKPVLVKWLPLILENFDT
jgi:hypothetical protein